MQHIARSVRESIFLRLFLADLASSVRKRPANIFFARTELTLG